MLRYGGEGWKRLQLLAIKHTKRTYTKLYSYFTVIICLGISIPWIRSGKIAGKVGERWCMCEEEGDVTDLSCRYSAAKKSFTLM